MEETEKRLCPFRKRVYSEYMRDPIRQIHKDKFAECAEGRCMAYRDGKCLRLEREQDGIKRH